MEINFLVIAIAAIVPLLTGFIWYHPKVFGTAWMNANGLTEADLQSGNMAKIFILTYIFSFMLSMMLQSLVIHQFSIYSVIMDEPEFKDPNSELSLMVASFMEKYGTNFRTFKHGMLHGVLAGIFIVLPIIGINSLFERKSFKYVALHVGYWMLTLGLMGGILCQYI
jgi:hypothetical protein